MNKITSNLSPQARAKARKKKRLIRQGIELGRFLIILAVIALGAKMILDEGVESTPTTNAAEE